MNDHETEAFKDQRTPEMKREAHLRERIKTLESELEAANLTIEHLRRGLPKQNLLNDWLNP